MYAGKFYRFVGIAWAMVMLIALVAVPVYSQDHTPQQTWTGEHIQQASMNWVDYAGEKSTLVHTEQPWAGKQIQQASVNWANYSEEDPAIVHTQQAWAGEHIQQVSMNWADYASQSAVAHTP